MRAVVQRVSSANISCDKIIISKINSGLLVYLGIGKEDTETDVEYLIKKILELRVFEDASGKMNKSILETGKELLIISQFTLYGDCRKGTRPSFMSAASPEQAKSLYDFFVKEAMKRNLKCEQGVFSAYMEVMSINDGPVTILLDSSKIF